MSLFGGRPRIEVTLSLSEKQTENINKKGAEKGPHWMGCWCDNQTVFVVKNPPRAQSHRHPFPTFPSGFRPTVQRSQRLAPCSLQKAPAEPLSCTVYSPPTAPIPSTFPFQGLLRTPSSSSSFPSSPACQRVGHRRRESGSTISSVLLIGAVWKASLNNSWAGLRMATRPAHFLGLLLCMCILAMVSCLSGFFLYTALCGRVLI